MKIVSGCSWGGGPVRMYTRLRKPPAVTTLRDIPSVAASLSMRVALEVQPAKNKASNRVAERCMGTIATRITTIVNGRGHSPRSVHSPVQLVLTGVAAHAAGLLRYLLSLGRRRLGLPSPNRRINKTREIGPCSFARLPEQAPCWEQYS